MDAPSPQTDAVLIRKQVDVISGGRDGCLQTIDQITGQQISERVWGSNWRCLMLVWGFNFHSITTKFGCFDERHLPRFQCIITSCMLVEWADGAALAESTNEKIPYEHEPIYSMWPPSATALNCCFFVCVGGCVCVGFCANVWCVHLMFAELINSRDAALRWHIL